LGPGESITRQALLRTAARAFADHGYRSTSVREITEATGANLAAVSYHFGGKAGLYRALAVAAVEDAQCDALEELGRGADAATDPLFGVVRRIVGCVAERHEGVCPWVILARELYEPTSVLRMLRRRLVKPTLKVLGELLGHAVPGSPPELRTHAARLVLARCLSWPLEQRLTASPGAGVPSSGLDAWTVGLTGIAFHSLRDRPKGPLQRSLPESPRQEE
jgi:AcrR family transcriptional regulator